MLFEIAPQIYYTGVNERTRKHFESLWPIPYGVSYNSYIIVDDSVALIDASEHSLEELHIQKIKEVLGTRPIDYLIINHMEPDHSGSLRAICKQYPNIVLVGNAKTIAMIHGFYDLNTALLEIKDGDTLTLGKHILNFHLTPMVHWPETMMSYEVSSQILFSGDAFGAFGALNGGVIDETMNLEVYWPEMRRYYASIVGKFGQNVQNALGKLASLPISCICPTHGPVWKSELKKAVAYYDKFSRYETDEGVVIAYGSMYGNTTMLAEQIAENLSIRGIKDIKLYDTGVTDLSYILSDIFKYKGLILGAPVYNGALYPPMESLMNAIVSRGIKDHLYASFGTFAWGANPLNELSEFGQQMDWETVYPNIRQKYTLQQRSFKMCQDLAQEMVTKLETSNK